MIKIKKAEIENDEFKGVSDIMESINGSINMATGMSNNKKELFIREWLTINMATISDETNVYSIDDIIERLNSVMKLERTLDKACEELEELSKEVGNWKTKEEWKEWCMK